MLSTKGGMEDVAQGCLLQVFQLRLAIDLAKITK